MGMLVVILAYIVGWDTPFSFNFGFWVDLDGDLALQRAK